MLKLLSFLWTGCWHDWKATYPVTITEWDSARHKTVIVARGQYYECTKCGRVKRETP